MLKYLYFMKFRLIKTQEELLKTLAKGFTLKETAEFLGLTYFNLQKRTALLYKKLDVHDRYSLISKALKLKLIRMSDVKQKFRNRFVKQDVSLPTVSLLTKQLTEQELEYLILLANGCTKNEIQEKMNILNIHFCNYIQEEICKKLNAKNMRHAVWIASVLKIINQ